MSAPDNDDEADWENYESGPFCRHWASPPSDCEKKCPTCGHPCWVHDDDACNAMWLDGVDDCACNGWKEPEE